jgi:hypothetical protein
MKPKHTKDDMHKECIDILNCSFGPEDGSSHVGVDVTDVLRQKEDAQRNQRGRTVHAFA